MTSSITSDSPLARPMNEIGQQFQIENFELVRALDCAVEIFGDWEWNPPGKRDYLAVPNRGGHAVLDVQRDVILPLVLAGRHFGWSFPAGLQQKLRNPTQTVDTLFELLCLGLLNQRHLVSYEPQLESRKVPDLRVELDGGPQVYVECKSHHMRDAVYWSKFQSVSSRLCEAIFDLQVVQDAFAAGLRTEVHADGRPSECHIREFRQKTAATSVSQLCAGVEIVPGTTVRSVPRKQRPRPDFGMYAGQAIVGFEAPMALTVENMPVVVYAWPRLLRECRTSQKNLIGEARRKLRGLPPSSVGLICIQTTLMKHFLNDVHALIDGEQFKLIPIIWVNPSIQPGSESRVVFRPEADALIKRLFRPNSGDD